MNNTENNTAAEEFELTNGEPMDLDDFVQTDIEVPVHHPRNQQVFLHVRLLPASDPKVKTASNKLLNARLNQRKFKITAEQIAEQGRARVLAAAISWRWEPGVTTGGTQPEFSAKALKDLMAKHEFVYTQLDEAFGDEGDFYVASPKD